MSGFDRGEVGVVLFILGVLWSFPTFMFYGRTVGLVALLWASIGLVLIVSDSDGGDA